jgi:hypothetical protein
VRKINSINVKASGKIHLALAAALKDQDADVRSGAAHVLEEIKPTDPQVLIEIYKAGDSDLNRTLGLTAEKIIALKAQLSASKNCVGSLGAFVK